MELQQSPFLTLISNRKVRQAMALMGQPKEACLTPEAAEQVCERTDSAAVLEGSIASVGSQYVLVRSLCHENIVGPHADDKGAI